jgi:adenylylsulfate kinase
MSKVIWFTGLSGAGKSTIAIALKAELKENNINSIILDGDALRNGINNNLGFSIDDRTENIRRIAEIAKLISNNNIVCIVATISPLHSMRQLAKEIISRQKFIEVFIDSPLAVCEMRDIKGLYKKARNNEIQLFTGITDIYEAPDNAIHINTHELNVDDSVAKLMREVLGQLI